MEKQIWKPGTVLYPVPAVMVSCGNMDRHHQYQSPHDLRFHPS